MDADDIAQRVIDLFLRGEGDDKTRRKFRTVRPADGEWTIVAGVVAIRGDEKRVISLGSGLKTMPDARIRERSQGRMVHDCHAEVLALRAFNAWVLEECVRRDPDSLLEFGDKPALKPGWKFALYVSELPCGDCSMASVVADLTARGQDTRPWEGPAPDPGSAVRGRGQFDRLGIVRTKPGRVDSPVSLSKSCSDKLAVRQFEGGLLSCVTAAVVDMRGFYVSYLVCPQSEVLLNERDIQRCFYTRFGRRPEWFRPLQVVPTAVAFACSRRGGDRRQAAALCFAWNPHDCDVIVQGVRNGRMKKGSGPVVAGAEPFVSRRALAASAGRLLGQLDGSYAAAFKPGDRALRKGKLEKMLGGWTSTSDDFVLT